MKSLIKTTLIGAFLALGTVSALATTITKREQLLQWVQQLINELQQADDSDATQEDDDFESFCEYKKRILEAAAHQGRYSYPIPQHCPSGENTFLDDDSEDFSLFAWLKQMSKKMKLANE